MDLQYILKQLDNCPCGKKHTLSLSALEVASRNVKRVGEILENNSFSKNILIVCDNNTLAASDGILESLDKHGYKYKIKKYTDLRVADMEEVEAIEKELPAFGGVLSVGTGSLNDICRLAAHRQKCDFAIFATAPSMDGFASDTAPITKNNFKKSYNATQPRIIIADTKVLATCPSYLKSAGFGDMIAKYIALVDWKVSTLLSGEYYCDRIASITKEAVDKMVSLADRVTAEDEETAGLIFESLCFTGLAMQFAGCSRPASGAEHIVSHFWEVKKLEQGKISDFHGKKVGVATVFMNKLYRKIASFESIYPITDKPDWEDIKAAYGKNLAEDMMSVNNPTITESISPSVISGHWQEIRNIINSILPTDEELLKIMKRAGAAIEISEIEVSKDLCDKGLLYHPYMRKRITMTRLLPMLNIGNALELLKQ